MPIQITALLVSGKEPADAKIQAEADKRPVTIEYVRDAAGVED